MRSIFTVCLEWNRLFIYKTCVIEDIFKRFTNILFIKPLKFSTFKGIAYFHVTFNGCGMGPLLVLVSPCFRETVVVICKIGYFFLCSLDNLLQKNVIVFFFENQISKWRSFEKKRAIFDLLFTFFSYQGKVTKNPSAHISLTYRPTCILLTLLTFFALPILKKIRIYQVWFLFGMSPGVDSYSRHFGTINK